MKLARRLFFSALVGVPAVAVVAPKPLTAAGASPWILKMRAKYEADRRTLIHDAHVVLGTIRVEQNLSAAQVEFSVRILQDMNLRYSVREMLERTYSEQVLYAASILAPFYAQTLGRGFYAIRENVGLLVTDAG